jgi:hypothetical protein
MTAQEYLAIKARICDTYEECIGCPFGYSNCPQVEYEEPEKAEKIVQIWAEANPFITNEDKFKKVFGFIPYTDWYNFSNGGINHIPDSRLSDYDWWTEEYKEK